MVTAIVLLQVEREGINAVAVALSAIDGVAEVYSVSGPHDLVAMLRVKDNDDLADLVTNKMLKVKGIIRTETLIAFRAYSRHDLDAMFSLGL